MSNIKVQVNQGFMSLATSFLVYGHHVARLRRRRRHLQGDTPTSNTASYDDHGKFTHGLTFLFFPVMSMALRFAALGVAGAPLKIPSALTDVGVGQFTTTMGHDNLK